MKGESRIEKLTEREKEALRPWLDHKTAKEIALDLGISHHAVEKRLKMARTKLDADTSLEAARILAEAEGYGQTVTGPADVQMASDRRKSWWHSTAIYGGITMISVTLLALALSTTDRTDGVQKVLTEGDRIEIQADIEPIFDELDEDESGYLENPESPFVTITFIDPQDASKMEGEAVVGDSDDPEQLAEFYSDADADKDGRISFREYHSWHRKNLAEMGIEISSVVRMAPNTES